MTTAAHAECGLTGVLWLIALSGTLLAACTANPQAEWLGGLPLSPLRGDPQYFAPDGPSEFVRGEVTVHLLLRLTEPMASEIAAANNKTCAERAIWAAAKAEAVLIYSLQSLLLSPLLRRCNVDILVMETILNGCDMTPSLLEYTRKAVARRDSYTHKNFTKIIVVSHEGVVQHLSNTTTPLSLLLPFGSVPLFNWDPYPAVFTLLHSQTDVVVVGEAVNTLCENRAAPYVSRKACLYDEYSMASLISSSAIYMLRVSAIQRLAIGTVKYCRFQPTINLSELQSQRFVWHYPVTSFLQVRLALSPSPVRIQDRNEESKLLASVKCPVIIIAHYVCNDTFGVPRWGCHLLSPAMLLNRTVNDPIAELVAKEVMVMVTAAPGTLPCPHPLFYSLVSLDLSPEMRFVKRIVVMDGFDATPESQSVFDTYVNCTRRFIESHGATHLTEWIMFKRKLWPYTYLRAILHLKEGPDGESFRNMSHLPITYMMQDDMPLLRPVETHFAISFFKENPRATYLRTNRRFTLHAGRDALFAPRDAPRAFGPVAEGTFWADFNHFSPTSYYADVVLKKQCYYPLQYIEACFGKLGRAKHMQTHVNGFLGAIPQTAHIHRHARLISGRDPAFEIDCHRMLYYSWDFLERTITRGTAIELLAGNTSHCEPARRVRRVQGPPGPGGGVAKGRRRLGGGAAKGRKGRSRR